MVVAGIAVVMGAFLHSLLSGWETWTVVCLAGGAIVAVLSCPPVRQKIGPQSGKKSVVYNLALGVLLFALALTTPALGSSFGPQKLDKAVKKSVSLLSAGDLERAEHLLTELLVQYPDVPEIRLNLSSVYLRKGQPEKAISVLEEVKEHRLFNASELFNYALACYQKGEFKDALVNLQKALLMEPGLAEGWLYAGECALKLGEYKAALYYLGQLAQIKPKLPLAHVQLARTHLMVMDYREALAELEKAMELEPEAQLRQEILKLKEEAGYYRSRIAESSN